MLAEAYSQLQAEIAKAAHAAHRDSASIHLVAVTKYASLAEMQEAYQLGIRDFGESRLQAALPKMQHFSANVRWHFIGALQSNKIGKIVEHFDVIHSVDSVKIARLIAEKSHALNKRPSLFLQVNISGETSKGGFSEEELLEHFDQLSTLRLSIIGLMTMAPLTSDVAMIQNCFRQLRLLAQRLSLLELSMGMSQDFPLAIAEGATYLRIGSCLFEGHRHQVS